MAISARYKTSVAFLRKIDADWAGLIDRIGPCRHDPKAARELYEALVRAIGYQQLTAKAGDAMIARLKALHPAVALTQLIRMRRRVRLATPTCLH